MTDKKKPRVIVLESNEKILENACSILSRDGWDVSCEKTSNSALKRLTQSSKPLFALFISSSSLPKMEGDDILRQVKSISPFTQRMIMVPADKRDILISAINNAEVNACITIPFKEEEFTRLAQNCHKNFKERKKKEQLKRIASHQNKQMVNIAKKLKKKDAGYKQLIDSKKTKRSKLASQKSREERQIHMRSRPSLPDLIAHKQIRENQESFKNEFIFLCDLISEEFMPFTKDYHIDPALFKYKNHFKSLDQSEDEPEKFPPSELIEALIQSALTKAMDAAGSPLDQEPALDAIEKKDIHAPDGDETPHILDEFFTVTLSEDQVTAVIEKKESTKDGSSQYSALEILDLLRTKQIHYGILDDEAIDTWLKKSSVRRIAVATGDPPDPGENGSIFYHFETRFTNPGKINKDGSIDFRDRGETPFVRKNDLLAQKKPARQGKPGMSVSGTPITVEEMEDPVFDPGPGTQLSEDGKSILAAIDGQPHLDKLGTISVSPELVIPGNVDYETGNVNFHGNIVVRGMIKEGFKVKGVNLTVQEIEGGIIDISGDLQVSAGITEGQISAQGNIYTKFINNSKIMGFGDLHVSKEIIDSNIVLSGKCINQTGHILSSKISAKLGIDAGSIGTKSSKQSTLKVGIDEHVTLLKQQAVEAIEASVLKSNQLRDEIKALEDQDKALYQLIAEKAQIQDRAQLDIKEMTKDLKALEELNDQAQIQLVSDEIKNIRNTAKAAERELGTIFENQDKIAADIREFKNQLKTLEEKNQTLVREKKALKVFEQKQKPVPVVTVLKTIVQDTIIKGPHASIVLFEDKSKCKIRELGSNESGVDLFEMTFCEL
jgi:hypothetical protein